MGADMKSVFLATTFAVVTVAAAFAPSVQAADVTAPVLKAPPAAIYDWTGLYVGGHVGWETARTEGSALSIAPSGQGCLDPTGTICAAGGTLQTPTDQTLNGWRGGVQIGYNHQFRRAVIGLELSGSWEGVNNQNTGTTTTPGGGITRVSSLACYQSVAFSIVPVSSIDTLTCNSKHDWTAQAVTRFGYTFMDNRLLPYVTAGVAFTHLQSAQTLVATIPSTAQLFAPIPWGTSKVLVGGVVGVGAQYALGSGLSIGAEYLYANYGTQDFSSIASNNPFDIAGPPVQEKHNLTTQTVRFVFNYKLAE
jgi:opacity protein-like surface antigen